MSTSTSTTTTDPTPFLVRFYDPTIQAPDPQGRTLSSLLALSSTNLERRHDYIQLLFPLPETSAYSVNAPVIDRATFIAFRSRPELRAQLVKSLNLMLGFYGFEYTESPGLSPWSEPAGDNPDDINDADIVPDSLLFMMSRSWTKPRNHNQLRITRIIRSLRVLGLELHAASFYRALKIVYADYKYGSDIGARTMMFWTRAAERPLYLAPQDEHDEGLGKDFLYEFEMARGGRADGDAAAAVAADSAAQDGKGKVLGEVGEGSGEMAKPA